MKSSVALLESTQARHVSLAPARRAKRSWEVSHLRQLSRAELDAVIGVMPAWMHHRSWCPPKGADTVLLWEFIERHGLGGALGALASDGLLPGGELADLALDRYRSNVLHCERARLTCRKIFGVQKEIGLPVLNLKGPVLAEQAYADGGVRAFSDLDLWTVSRAGTFELLKVLNARIIEDNDLRGVIRRVRAPGDILASLDGWELEIRYPTPEPTDPMLAFLAGLAPGAWIQDDGCLAALNPAQHLLVLLMHMSYYHYFSRFVWFLDLAALVSRRRAEIDFDWLQHQTKRLGAANLLGVAAHFCRKHIDSEFPEFPRDQAAWNYGVLRRTVDAGTIAAGRFSTNQRNRLSLARILWLRSIRHFLLSDPPPRRLADSVAMQQVVASIAWGLRFTGRPLKTFFRVLVTLLLYPAAKLTAWILSVRLKQEVGFEL